MTALQRAELAIAPEDAEVRRASEWLSQQAGHMRIPATQTQRLDLCLNEALANVLTHGGPGVFTAPVHIQLERLEASTGDEAGVTVIDAGHPFDPSTATIGPRPGSLDEAEPGGLGLLMIRSYADDLHYRHEAGRNRLRFTVRWASNPGSQSAARN
jgi:serine/threonine-protein kinase RsbW